MLRVASTGSSLRRGAYRSRSHSRAQRAQLRVVGWLGGRAGGWVGSWVGGCVWSGLCAGGWAAELIGACVGGSARVKDSSGQAKSTRILYPGHRSGGWVVASVARSGARSLRTVNSCVVCCKFGECLVFDVK